MIQILLKPLEGISISGIGEIFLGDKMEQVEKIIGRPVNLTPVEIGNIYANQAFYFQFEMRVDYNKQNQVEFIEFLFGPWPEKTELTIYGKNPFEVESEELVKLLSSENNGNVNETEAPYCYGFSEIGVGIWRESHPKDIEDWLQEKKEKGEYETNKTWLDEELEKSKHFWTIGIGKKGYY